MIDYSKQIHTLYEFYNLTLFSLDHMSETLIHTPIMVKEIIDNLPNQCQLYVDGTAGHGGHIAAIAASGKLATHASIYAVDRDAAMLEKARTQTADLSYTMHYIHNSYANIKTILWDQKADFILLDIGVNMEHFKDGNRGFSIHEDAPLDMRFDTTQWDTAADLVNTGSKELLVWAFMKYGDFSEKSATFFYDRLVERRATKPIITTADFVDFWYSIGVRKNQLPVLFQCLRIITNQELEQLEDFLRDMPDCLAPWGRCALITFHSTEDRIVKYAFKALADSEKFSLVNKKVIAPHYTEVQKNRAARSAKLRVIEKL